MIIMGLYLFVLICVRNIKISILIFSNINNVEIILFLCLLLLVTNKFVLNMYVIYNNFK